jgi:hypothetical protein
LAELSLDGKRANIAIDLTARQSQEAQIQSASSASHSSKKSNLHIMKAYTYAFILDLLTTIPASMATNL